MPIERPSPEPRIRPAVPEDGELVAQMCAALNAAANLGGAQRITAAEFRGDGFGSDPAFACLIAEAGGEAIGYALHCPDYDTDLLSRSVYLADLYVAAAARRHGVGRALIAAVAGDTHVQGARSMMWGTVDSNLDARRFYAAIGEEITDQIASRIGGEGFVQLAAHDPPAEGLTVRAAEVEDCPLLERFLLAMVRDIALPAPADAAARFRADGFGADPAFTAVIAERAGEPVGYALFAPTYDTAASRRHGAWLSDLYVTPPERRNGIAMHLMAEVARRTAARRGTYLRWLVHADNHRARAFYRRFAEEWRGVRAWICRPELFEALARGAILNEP